MGRRRNLLGSCGESVIPSNQIWYTTIDKSTVTPYAQDVFGVNIVSNIYNIDKGVITFDGELTTIGNYAFYECSSLTSITIPDNVTTIGWSAFRECSSLESVYCKSTTPPSIGGDVFYNNASGRMIYVPAESVEAYKASTNWSNYIADIVGYDF